MNRFTPTAIGTATALLAMACAAGPVHPELALELVSAHRTQTTAGNGRISVSGPGVEGAVGSSFAGSLSSSASVDIDDFDDDRSYAQSTWEYVFKIKEPLVGDLSVSYLFGFSSGAYSHHAATSYGSAGLSSLSAKVVAPNGYQYEVFQWADDADGTRCDTSAFEECKPGYYTETGLGGSHTFHYAPGYAPGSLVTLSGQLWSTAWADTYAGSGEAAGSSWLSFDLRVLPEPSQAGLAGIALLAVAAASRRTRCTRRPGRAAEQSR